MNSRPDRRPGSFHRKVKDQTLLSSHSCHKVFKPYPSYKPGGHLSKELGKEVKHKNLASTLKYGSSKRDHLNGRDWVILNQNAYVSPLNRKINMFFGTSGDYKTEL